MGRIQFMGEGGREALVAQVLEPPRLQSVVHARTVAVPQSPVSGCSSRIASLAPGEYGRRAISRVDHYLR